MAFYPESIPEGGSKPFAGMPGMWQQPIWASSALAIHLYESNQTPTPCSGGGCYDFGVHSVYGDADQPFLTEGTFPWVAEFAEYLVTLRACNAIDDATGECSA